MADYKTISAPYAYSGALNNFERDVMSKADMSNKRSYGAYPDLFTVICSDIDPNTGEPGPDHGKLFIIDKSRELDPEYGYCVPASSGELPDNVTKTFDEMPDPEKFDAGTIVQYVGDTTDDYDTGNFYKATDDGGTLVWKHVAQGADIPENVTEALKEMPTPTAEDLGRYVQYIGNDTSDYAGGNFYRAIENPDGTTPPYIWEHVNQITDVPENLTEALKDMPTPTSDDLGRIAQYVGPDTSDYNSGNFYKVIENPAGTPPYIWERINQGTTATEAFKEMPDPTKYEEGTVAQYVGPETTDYSTGNFYKVANVDGNLVWQHISQGSDGPDPETKNYTEAVKEMPDPKEYVGKYVQYIGEDTADYVGGNFYKAIEDPDSATIPNLYQLTGSFSYSFDGEYKELTVVMKGESRNIGDPIYSLTFDDEKQAYLTEIGKVTRYEPLVVLEGLGGDPNTEAKAISDLINLFDGVHNFTSINPSPREYLKSTNPTLRPEPLFSLKFTPTHSIYDGIFWNYTYNGSKTANIIITGDPDYRTGYYEKDPYVYWFELEETPYQTTVVGKYKLGKVTQLVDLPADAVGFEELYTKCFKIEKCEDEPAESGSELETVRNMFFEAIDQSENGLFFAEMKPTSELSLPYTIASHWKDLDKFVPAVETSQLYQLGNVVNFYYDASYEAYLLSFPLHPEQYGFDVRLYPVVVMFKDSDYDNPAVCRYDGRITDYSGIEDFYMNVTKQSTDPSMQTEFYMRFSTGLWGDERLTAFLTAAGFTQDTTGPNDWFKYDVPQSLTPWTMYRKGETPYKDYSYKWEHVDQGDGGGSTPAVFNGSGKLNMSNFDAINEYKDFSFIDFMTIATATAPTFTHTIVAGETQIHGTIVSNARIMFNMTTPGSSPIESAKVNGTAVSETYTGSGVYEYVETQVNDTTDFVLTGKCKDGTQFEYTCTMKFIYPWYCGTLSKNSSITRSDIETAIASGKLTRKMEEFTNTSRETTLTPVTSDGEYVAIVCLCDNPTIKDQNGFDNTKDFTLVATVSLHRASYSVYVAKNICVCEDFKYVIS